MADRERHSARARNATPQQVVEQGLVYALLVPLRGEALGWTAGIALWGVWMTAVLKFFGPIPLLGLLAVVGSVAIFYRLCAGYFDACFAGARAGRLEPVQTSASGDFSVMGYALGGGGVLLYMLGYVFATAGVLMASGVDVAEPGIADRVAAFGVRTLLVFPVPVAFALRAATQSNFALFAFARQARVVRAAGVGYIAPAAIAGFALAVPYSLVQVAAEAGFVPVLVDLLVSSAMCAYVFGAMGAAMGWIANRSKVVDDLLG